MRAGQLLYYGGLNGLTRYADNRIWSWAASEGEWRNMPLQGLLSARRTTEGIICRALSDEAPTPFAEPALPTVEEGYLSLISLEGNML